MHKFTALTAISVMALASAPSWAQLLEEVVVTGSRVTGDDYSRIPAVVIQRRAQCVHQGRAGQ